MARPALRNPVADNARLVTRERRTHDKPKKLAVYTGPVAPADDFNIRGIAAQMNRIGGAIRGTRPDRVVPAKLSRAA